MSFTYEDIEAYAVGFILVMAIYGLMFWLLPKLFARAKKAAAPVTAPIVAAVKEAVKFKFPYPVTEVAGADAFALWEESRKRGETGTVLFGGYEQGIDDHAQSMVYRKFSPAEYIARAVKKPEPFPTKPKPKLPKEWPHQGPIVSDRNPFVIYKNPEGFKSYVALVTTPAKDDAEIFAHLKFGGWNGCPEPDVHVAAMRKWQRDYGAELVGFTLDALDVRVKRRPATRQEAMVLAREHQKYCPTNEATLPEIAAELMETDWWHFWWD
jgi:hypothetical protein